MCIVCFLLQTARTDAGRQLGLRPGAFFETFFKPALREPYVKLERGEMALTDFARIFAQELPRGVGDNIAHRKHRSLI